VSHHVGYAAIALLLVLLCVVLPLVLTGQVTLPTAK
jgi:hypothetical protein